MLVSQQVAAEIQKYTRSAQDNMNTVDNATANQDKPLKSIVQSAVAEHFKTCKLTRLLNIPPANCYSPPTNWGERVSNNINKPT